MKTRIKTSLVYFKFSSRLLAYFSRAVILAFTVLLLFTLLSRLGLPLFGGMIVFSGSMEPTLRKGDLIIFYNGGYGVGDIIVYSYTPSYIIVHRVVDIYIRADTGEKLVVTKGDANPLEDPPISSRLVRGVVVFSALREVWMPFVALAAVVALADIWRTRVIGPSYVVAFVTALTYIIAVYAIVPSIPALAQPIQAPAIHLSRIDFDPRTCNVIIKYVGELHITEAAAYILLGDEVLQVEAQSNGTCILFTLPAELAGFAYGEGKPLTVRVIAGLNNAGELSGEYRVRVHGFEPVIGAEGGSLVLRNPNGFPVAMNITFLYAYGVGEDWKISERRIVLGGLEEVEVEPPEGAAFAYADVSYRAWGDWRWARLRVR